MNKEMSLYLDLVRFGSAMVVFLGHAAGKLTGGFLWQLNSYLGAAVMIFFVLSGYVIAYVYDIKDKSIKIYSIDRIARFSSVAIPALIITAFFDFFGTQINPELYYNGPWPEPAPYVLNYVLSAFYIQNIWGMSLNPGINVPFWTLSYEFGFYFLFAFFVYFTGLKRIVVLILLCLLLGPDILTYTPIWLMGVMIYYLHKRIKYINPVIAVGSFILSASILIFLIPYIGTNIQYTPPFFLGTKNVLAEYIYALIFSIHIFFAFYTLTITKLLQPLRKPIVILASCTFSLYLFHRPLIQFFAALELGEPESLINRVAVLGGTLIIVYTVGFWAESQKHKVKLILTKRFNS